MSKVANEFDSIRRPSGVAPLADPDIYERETRDKDIASRIINERERSLRI
jgi:hypothetical protein